MAESEAFIYKRTSIFRENSAEYLDAVFNSKYTSKVSNFIFSRIAVLSALIIGIMLACFNDTAKGIAQKDLFAGSSSEQASSPTFPDANFYE